MAKNNQYDRFEKWDNEEEYSHLSYYNELQERRKNKRLRTALKTRDIESLINQTEEDY